jgi:hypothetical protein
MLRKNIGEGGSLLKPEQPIGLASKTDQEVSQVQRFSNTQAGSEPFGKLCTLLLYSNGLQISRFDPFCLENDSF